MHWMGNITPWRRWGLGKLSWDPHQCYKVLQSFKGGSLGVQPCTPLCESTSERAFKFPSYFDAVCLLLWFAAKILWEISDVMGSHIYSEMCIWKCSQIFCTRYHCWLCKARNVLHSYMRRHIVVMCPHPVHPAITWCFQSDVSRFKNCTLPSARCQARCHGLKASGAALYHLFGSQRILLEHQTQNIIHLSQPGFSKKQSQVWTNTISDLIWNC